jgi:alpha-N-arabinofuranosidase
MRIANYLCRLSLSAMVLFGATNANAQAANLWVYTNGLVNGFADWSWNSTRNLINTTPVHSASNSIAVTITASGGALRFQSTIATLYPGDYAQVSFWINGGRSGGQLLGVQAVANNAPLNAGVLLAPLAQNAWQQYIIPLSALGVTSNSALSGFWIQDTSGGPQPVFYVDDVDFVAVTTSPKTAHLNLDPTQVARTADARWFGLNTAAWDGYLDSSDTVSALAELGTQVLRWPGGSWGDIYHEYAPPNSGYGSYTTNFIHIATNAHAQAFMIANYGTGTSNEAADWVRLCNVTNHCAFKYWEIGNECYGSWEADNNTNPPYVVHDPWTYAMRFRDYYNAMKAVDPTIKIGAVAVPGEDSDVNNLSHPVTNPRTHITHYGWTPVMLTYLRSLAIKPDFLVDHFYPEYQADSDPFLLQSTGIWTNQAADLRQQLNDYFQGAVPGIELVCTENNSDSGNQGRQSTSIVNALYQADSMSQLMKTEFNAFLWWDLRNGQNFPSDGGDFNSTLYGWRSWGDMGIMLGGTTIRYPTFYSMKLMQYFVRAGDTVLNASSDSRYLSTYAASNSSGGLTLLVINKSPDSTLNGQIVVTNFVPWPVATVRSYGIAQDEATRTNAPIQAQDIALTTYSPASTNFTYSFPPYSLTLFSFSPFAAPAAPQLAVLPAAAGQFVFQLQGQNGVPYVIERSADLLSWTSVSTNTLTSGALNVTNPVPPGSTQQFWRSVWLY